MSFSKKIFEFQASQRTQSTQSELTRPQRRFPWRSTCPRPLQGDSITCSENLFIIVKTAKNNFKRGIIAKVLSCCIFSFRGVLGPLELDESLAPAPYTTSFTGTTVSGVAKMDVVGGKLRIVQDPDVTINVEGLNVQMENLFGGEADGLAKVVLRWGVGFDSFATSDRSSLPYYLPIEKRSLAPTFCLFTQQMSECQNSHPGSRQTNNNKKKTDNSNNN